MEEAQNQAVSTELCVKQCYEIGPWLCQCLWYKSSWEVILFWLLKPLRIAYKFHIDYNNQNETDITTTHSTECNLH